jgi:uncharacterized phiE125 gp8 family phage protein
MTFRRTVAPTAEPITLDQAKLELRVENTLEDDRISGFITAVREEVEHELRRSLMPQTWQLLLDEFPCDAIQLANPPIVAVTAVTYIDTDGVQQTLDPTAYTLDPDYLPGFLLPAYGVEWPATEDVANAVSITYTTGYADAASVPQAIKTWMLLRLRTLYRPSEDWTPMYDRMLDPHRVFA